MAPAARQVIVLNGPVGVGKTTLGRAVAAELGAAFIDGDDLHDPGKHWFEDVLTASHALVRAGRDALERRSTLVVAKPLRARDWRFLEGRFGALGITAHCVTLSARLDAILDPARGRVLDAHERARAAEMIEQGYAARPFSATIVETDRQDLIATVAHLMHVCRGLLATPPRRDLADGAAPRLHDAR